MVNVPINGNKRGIPPRPAPMSINSFGQNLNKGSTIPLKVDLNPDLNMINIQGIPATPPKDDFSI